MKKRISLHKNKPTISRDNHLLQKETQKRLPGEKWPPPAVHQGANRKYWIIKSEIRIKPWHTKKVKVK